MPMNADKNYASFIRVDRRSSAAQNTFIVGWQPTSDARPAWHWIRLMKRNTRQKNLRDPGTTERTSRE
jgi:hypothetical protein